MKSEINAALRERCDAASLPYPAAATNVELARTLLDHAGESYGFFETADDLIAKLVDPA